MGPESDAGVEGNNDQGSVEAKAYEALLGDAPKEDSSEPESERIEDKDEAREMAEAGKPYREYAADYREHASDAPEQPVWGPSKTTLEDDARTNDEKADRLEDWAQALHHHPEFAGKTFSGEPITPWLLDMLAQEVQLRDADLKRLEGRLGLVATEPYSDDLGSFKARSSLTGSELMVPADAQRELQDKLKQLKSDDATTIGQLRTAIAEAVKPVIEQHKGELAARSSFLEQLKS